MRLLEYQGKQLFSEYGITVPVSQLALDEQGALDASKKIGFPLVLKSQLTVGGRGKAGAILKCSNESELIPKFNELLHKEVKGELPQGILIEGIVDIVKELYVSLYLNRGKRCYSLISSNEGGVNIESVDNKIIMDLPRMGLSRLVAEDIARKLDLGGTIGVSFVDIILKLDHLVKEKEAELAEINPVAILPDGSCLALDSKIIIDDNSIFRHPALRKFQHVSELQAQAEKSGFSFVELDGDIAIIGNGAGLVMSTLDLVNDNAGKPGAFLDFGGRATTETIYQALEVISKSSRIKAILVNLFGGIVRTDLVAQAILDAYKNGIISVPIYARISGAESEKAKHMLSDSRAKIYDSVEEAISSLVTYVRGGSS
ncbi:MAG: succinate--CoA ligase subunit beta [Thermoproteota archaeon]|nr:succinate--CoA ligase subunit beta [Thermoproteota archaeon]